MSDVQDPWLVLLTKARDDLRLAEKLQDDLDATDEQVGFFCQQAVEKAIKSVLSKRGVLFPYTHDLTRLFELLSISRISAPPDRDDCEALTPYAASLRYDRIPTGSGATPLDRPRAVKAARIALDWAIGETT